MNDLSCKLWTCDDDDTGMIKIDRVIVGSSIITKAPLSMLLMRDYSVGTRNISKFSTHFTQKYCCEPKTFLKNKVYLNIYIYTFNRERSSYVQ